MKEKHVLLLVRRSKQGKTENSEQQNSSCFRGKEKGNDGEGPIKTGRARSSILYVSKPNHAPSSTRNGKQERRAVSKAAARISAGQKTRTRRKQGESAQEERKTDEGSEGGGSKGNERKEPVSPMMMYLKRYW
jgi:hypothetical protein